MQGTAGAETQNPIQNSALIGQVQETLARALCIHEGGQPDRVDADGVPRWHWYRAEAAAVLQALHAAGFVIAPHVANRAQRDAGAVALLTAIPEILRPKAIRDEDRDMAAAVWQHMAAILIPRSPDDGS